MVIGKPIRVIDVHPLELPLPRPAEQPVPVEEPEAVHEPEPEEVRR